MHVRSNYWHHQQHPALSHTKIKFHHLPQHQITRPARQLRRSAANMSTVHLVVLQHGLWGSPDDVANLTSYLEKALAQQTTHEDEQLALLKSAVNARRLTYDGIDVCGARLAQLVQDTIQQYADGGKKVTKLSMMGYSLGGVISRFAAGKLYVAGVFEEVQPMNLITVASPHLGSFREPRGLWARFFNSQVPIIASRTGRQLMLVDSDYSVPWLTQQQEMHNRVSKQHHDTHRNAQQTEQQQQNGQQQQQQQEQQGVVHLKQVELKEQQQQQPAGGGSDNSSESKDPSSSSSGGSKLDQHQQQQRGVVLPPGVDPDQAVPLLLLMAHPAGPFWRALKHFRTRICAANIRYDTMVPYCTAALRVTNPYEQTEPVPINPEKYPSVVRPATPEEESQIVPVPIRGRSRLFFLAVFVPMFPFFYVYSVTNGFWHHRQAKRRPLDLTWLQQYTVDHNPFSRQVSRRPSLKVRHHAVHQQQWQRQQQQRLSMAAEILEMEAAEARATAEQDRPAAAAAPAAAAGKQISSNRPSPVSLRSHRSSSITVSPPSPAAAGGSGQISPFSAAAGADHHQQQHSKDGGLSPPRSVAAAAAAALPHMSAAKSLERALTSEGVLERDGIIEDPWIVHQQQQWMAQQLFDNMPPCWVPERTIPSSSGSSKVQGDPTVGTTSGARSDHKASSSSAVVAEAPAAAAGVKSKAEAETVLTTVKLEPQQQQLQSQQENISASSPPTSPGTAVAAAASSSGSGSAGFKSQGGWHRVDVWMGHMHAHAAIMIRDKRFDAESRDMFQYLADHFNL